MLLADRLACLAPPFLEGGTAPSEEWSPREDDPLTDFVTAAPHEADGVSKGVLRRAKADCIGAPHSEVLPSSRRANICLPVTMETVDGP